MIGIQTEGHTHRHFATQAYPLRHKGRMAWASNPVTREVEAVGRVLATEIDIPRIALEYEEEDDAALAVRLEDLHGPQSCVGPLVLSRNCRQEPPPNVLLRSTPFTAKRNWHEDRDHRLLQ
ncbi:hypothetical protein [Thioalkalivibrio sp. ALE16]|uniref:hypothetical protein n=1 Tax=Thioalkalivibrio sp. ALE16 TaxID=1158172 RepID=UPI0012DBF5B1|nr:hypothetical protein [Thioalkalivibrio sp. ALE16]